GTAGQVRGRDLFRPFRAPRQSRKISKSGSTPQRPPRLVVRERGRVHHGDTEEAPRTPSTGLAGDHVIEGNCIVFLVACVFTRPRCDLRVSVVNVSSNSGEQGRNDGGNHPTC